MLVVFEGLDNLGKTTLIGKLGRRISLRDWGPDVSDPQVITGVEPPKSEVVVRRQTGDGLPLLLTAHEDYIRDLKQRMGSGSVILSDRWVYSNEAYREVRISEIVQPDLIIYLEPDCVYVPETQAGEQEEYDGLLKQCMKIMGLDLESPTLVNGVFLDYIGVCENFTGIKPMRTYMRNRRERLSDILARYNDILDRKTNEGVSVKRFPSNNLKRGSPLSRETENAIFRAIIDHPKFTNSIRGMYRMMSIDS